MCGIFGYCNINDNGARLLRIMADQQLHRGPDSEGFYTEGGFGLGIRRLSVIDLVTGDQPITNEDKSIRVVCNGEIYNYQELTIELKQKGHRFYTNSDVECIVHLYEEYGINCLKRLNGMFGLALFDAKKKHLYIARDRLGIKPLYYSALGNCFLFASELRSLLSTNLVSKEIDWEGLGCFLDQMYIPVPLSPFKKIRKLEPGHYLCIDDSNTVTEDSYWRLGDLPVEPLPRSEAEAIERLTFLLKDANRLQIRADVPICVFLSGGIDSSAVAVFAAMASSMPLRTFHVHFPEATKKIDERRYAAAVAQRYGTIHSEVAVSRNDFSRLIPKLIWHLEEPFGDLASIPTYIISEMARKEAVVCLNGSGGDELFAGYPHHRNSFLSRRSILSAVDRSGAGGTIRKLLGKSYNLDHWKKIFPGYVDRSLRDMAYQPGKAFGGRINRVLAQDIDGYLQSNVLFLLDKIAMAVSLEGRVPLLDHRFVEVAAHLPASWKIKNGEAKYIFKKMLEPYLPYELLYRKKEGFGAPLEDWIDEKTRINLRRIVENGLLNKSQLLRLENISFKSISPWDLWKIACLELWYRIIISSSGCPQGKTLEDFA
ncbi:MAG: asparagine synthase (glutamine-hydrolyzing) [Candidatus Omnitrophica bacterium]|nr:asparagine synthase (glutamine-hydrolyzing) [Candidatus Omnitrophota bacterium]